MKKSILMLAALAFCGTSAFAQIENKKGEAYLPEAGDWAIGIDASPVVNYFGNMFNGNTNNNSLGSAWNFTNANQIITGKMFTSETMAYRGMVRLGFGSNHWDNIVADDASTAIPQGTTTDTYKQSWNAIGLGAGIEMRRGKTRLQGYYGAMLMFWMMGSKDTYTYGNAFTSTDNTPTTTDFTTMTSGPSAARTIDSKAGSTMGLGVRGFIGAEYFVLPKISIGGEFGWGLGFSSTGEGTTNTEVYDGTGAGKTVETKTAGSGSFWVDTDNANFGMAPAALLIHFHF